MDRRTARSTAVLAAALPTVLVMAVPATAGAKDTYSSKTSGGEATVQWTEHDPEDLLGLAGNTHVGYLGVYKMPGFLDVYGDIVDFDCDEGEVPHGGHGEPGCEVVGVRKLSGAANAAFSVDVRNGVARLTGNLEVRNGGHGPEGPEGPDGPTAPDAPIATPPVSITWTSTGSSGTFRSTETWTDGTSTYRSSIRGTSFEAQIGGAIGFMGFTDDTDDTSYGSVREWSERSRTRIG